MMRLPVTAKTWSAKNCLAFASTSLLHRTTGTSESGLIVVRALPGGRGDTAIYLSVTPHPHTSSDQLKLNALYAHRLGIRDDDVLMLETLDDVRPCVSAQIEPLTVDDWEILELHAAQVESGLLDQVRVVWPGQVFPLWVDGGGVCVFMRTTSVEPASSSCALLVPLTELVVEPKDRANSRTLKKQPLAVNDEETGDQAGMTQHSDVMEHQGFHEVFADILSFVHLQRFFRILKFLIFILPKQLANFVLSQVKSLFNLQLRDETRPDGDLAISGGRDERLGRLCALPDDFDVTMRVEPVAEYDATSSVISRDQASTLYLHSSQVTSRDDAEMYLVRVSRVPSPVEKTADDAKTGSSVVARMFVHPLSRFAMTTDWNELCASHHLKVSACLRAQLDAGVSTRVRVRPLAATPRTCADLKSVTLQVAAQQNADRSYDCLLESLRAWLEVITSRDMPLPITFGTVLEFQLLGDGGASVDAQVTDLVLRDPEQRAKSDTTTTYLLSADDVMSLEVNFVECDYAGKDVDFSLPSESALLYKDGFEREYDATLRFVEHSLAARPLCSAIAARNKREMRLRCLLVVGAKGTGKTTLCRCVMRKFGSDPFLNAYVRSVRCSVLRGKKAATIHRVLSDALTDAVWRQPSVLLLDDLDLLVPACVDGDDDERTPDVMYTVQLAAAVRCWLSRVRATPSKVAVLATSKSKDSLHSSLSAGSRAFGATVEIPLPDAVRRRVVVSSLVENFTSFASLSQSAADAVVRDTEGFAARDLHSVVQRAVHVAQCRNLTTCADALFPARDQLLAEDFASALADFTPSSLHDVNLHRPTPVLWSDVGGLEEIKRKLVEQLVWPLRYQHLFERCGLRSGAGVLLFGPPGCGKTLIASAVANQCKLNFISVKGPELLSKYIGASEAAVRDLFTRAQAAKPCVLFFDEFDSLAPPRGHDSTGVTDRVVNQLLTHLDGVEPLVGVTVMAATSRPDLLDPALLRPGRLDHLLYCPLPDEHERLEILTTLSKGLHLRDCVDFAGLARACANFTGADLKSLLYNAQLAAVHEAYDDCDDDGSTLSDCATTVSTLSTLTNGSLALDDVYLSNGFDAMPLYDDTGVTSTTWPGSFDADVQDTAAALIVSVSDEGIGNRDAQHPTPAMTAVSWNGDEVAPLDVNYFPSLHQGRVGSVPSGVLQQAMQLTRSPQYHSDPETGRKAVRSVEVAERHVRAALAATRPSLTPSALREFEQLYSGFVRSRLKTADGGEKLMGKGKPRATLS